MEPELFVAPPCLCVAFSCLSLAVDMASHVERDGATSARRRRERRLRSWWRHECQGVRMALTAATHHSAAKVVASEMNSGLRTQTTVSAGSRKAALKEPELLVGGLGAPRCPGSGVPSLALAVLGGDGVDASCLAFLVRRAVEDKKKKEEEEEEEERKKKVKRQQAQIIEEVLWVQERTQEPLRMKRKKKRGGSDFLVPLLGLRCSSGGDSRLRVRVCPTSGTTSSVLSRVRRRMCLQGGEGVATVAGTFRPKAVFSTIPNSNLNLELNFQIVPCFRVLNVLPSFTDFVGSIGRKVKRRKKKKKKTKGEKQRKTWKEMKTKGKRRTHF